MRFITTVLILCLTAPAWAQIDVNDKRKGKFKNSVFLPDSAMWFNCEKPHTDFIKNKKLGLIHFWNPESPGGTSLVQDINNWVPDHLEYSVVTVVEQPLEHPYSPTEIEDLIIRHQIRNPLALYTKIDDVPGVGPIEAPMVVLLDDNGELIEKYIGPAEIRTSWDLLDSLGYQGMKEERLTKIFKSYKSLPDKAPKPVLGNLTHIEASSREGRMFVCDQQKHRILLLDATGQINEKIGAGVKGFEDGKAAFAKFNAPSGMAYDEQNKILYLADTYNHAIRQIEMRYGFVTTILGNGEEGLQIPSEVVGTTGRLSFPTDVALWDGKLYIAMSGYNQIWEMDLSTGKAKPYAGDGKQGSEDGKGTDARIDRPRSISVTRDGDLVFSEPFTGRIREIGSKGKVKTIYEPKGDTLVGDLSRPTGVLAYDGDVLIADQYNHRVCQLNKFQLASLCGSGEEGYVNGKGEKTQFSQPSDLAIFEGDLMVLDYGNGVIRRISMKNGKSTSMNITGISGVKDYEQAITHGERVYLPAVQMPGRDANITFTVELGDDYEVVSFGRNEIAIDDPKRFNDVLTDNMNSGSAVIGVSGNPDNLNIQMELYITYRKKDVPEVIYYQSAMVLIPIERGAAGNPNVVYNLTEGFVR